MIKFADLGIKSRLRGEIYNCKTISIKSIIDKEIVILGVQKHQHIMEMIDIYCINNEN